MTTPYGLSRAELFRRFARAITLLLARNNAAAAVHRCDEYSRRSAIESPFHRTVFNNNILFQDRGDVL